MSVPEISPLTSVHPTITFDVFFIEKKFSHFWGTTGIGSLLSCREMYYISMCF